MCGPIEGLSNELCLDLSTHLLTSISQQCPDWSHITSRPKNSKWFRSLWCDKNGAALVTMSDHRRDASLNIFYKRFGISIMNKIKRTLHKCDIDDDRHGREIMGGSNHDCDCSQRKLYFKVVNILDIKLR